MRRILVFIMILVIVLLCLLPASAQNNSQEEKSMKILCIGHSYSMFIAPTVYEMAAANGWKVTVGVAYRGNCSYAEHLAYLDNNTLYAEQDSGNMGYYLKCDNYHPEGEKIETMALSNIITDEKWDAIIYQDCLNTCGLLDAAIDYLVPLHELVSDKATNPNVRYYIQELWAFEDPSVIPLTEPLFKAYHENPTEMYAAVKTTTDQAAALIGAKVIPSGDAFHLARQSGSYDPTKGGKALCGDAVGHPNIYGKYLASAVWLDTLFARKPEPNYLPYLFNGEQRIGRLTEQEATALLDFADQAVKAKDGLLPEEPTQETPVSSQTAVTPKEKSFPRVPLVVAAGVLTVAGCVTAFILRKKKQ